MAEPLQRGPLGTLKHDLPAGLVVFLVALPLCLGIAHASGVPPIAGVITGVIGGMVVSWLSGSHTCVSGPAAGLIVIVFAAAQDLGYGGMLLATVLAGGMQFAFGALRFGGLSRLVPSAVVKGMLVAIGAIMIIKQLPHAVGWAAHGAPSDGNAYTALPGSLGEVHLGALVLCAVGLGLIAAAERVPWLKNPWLPGPLLAVVAGVALNAVFMAIAPRLAVGGALLTNIPPGDPSALGAELASPTWSMIGRLDVWTTAITIALVASLETLLCVEALDGLDPLGRKTPRDRELLAQGTGNALVGLLGGIPMTALIVRGSTNLAAGAKSRLGSFTHGTLLFVAVLSVPWLLNRIPLASLSAVLISVGYRLARPQGVIAVLKRSLGHAVPFAVTVAGILVTDLLIGVLSGFAVAIAFVVAEVVLAHQRDKPGVLLKLGPIVPPLSRFVVERSVGRASDGSRVVIDGSDADDIHDDLRRAFELLKKRAADRRIVVELQLPQASEASH